MSGILPNTCPFVAALPLKISEYLNKFSKW
nr:MAG TPA: hypothetical protein [Caudoviricetes sp.]